MFCDFQKDDTQYYAFDTFYSARLKNDTQEYAFNVFDMTSIKKTLEKSKRLVMF